MIKHLNRPRTFFALTPLVLILLQSPVSAAWQSKVVQDAATGKHYTVALTSNSDGYRLMFWRHHDSIIGTFIVPEASPFTLQPRRPIRWVVDQFPVVEKSNLESNLDPLYAVFVARRPGEDNTALAQLMNGRRVYFHFEAILYGMQETVFDLKGSRKAIQKLLDAER